MPRLSIIIVSFNACAELERCLASLHEPPPLVPHEIVVDDNGSTDGSADAARQWPAVRVIEAGSNLGFSRGTNAGIRASTGEYVLLLNSDTIVPEGAVDRLVDELERDRDVAVVAPRLIDEAGRAELSFGSMVGPLNEFRQRLLVRGHERGVTPVSDWVEWVTKRPRFPDWVSGACLLVRREAAEAVGLLDERYFMYAEDVDFCAAIRARGSRVKFAPASTVIHARGRSAAAAPLATRVAYRQSQLAFYAKHHPGWVPWLRLYLRLRRAPIEIAPGRNRDK